ncbi:receptor-type tyrosine-protein phosphatase C isoform X2 [Phycodurus eques]|uniref:receptor-type tyrosine-protein phosphatase C isoform X2 n=1 Tax=Phycodurus eques TaxID=693459 RepID=UPI002ACD2B73|nr:receptor-type tyrosine-protein phosphatase C isoform X2 [Phycodurus eques]
MHVKAASFGVTSLSLDLGRGEVFGFGEQVQEAASTDKTPNVTCGWCLVAHMEGLCGLWTLLLWATIISSAYCQSKIVTTPVPSKEATSAHISNSNTLVSPPPNTLQISNASTPFQCSYNVTNIKYGFRFDITSSSTDGYRILLTENGLTSPLETTIYNKTSVDIPHLKPCTEYEHKVEYLASDGETETCIFSNGVLNSTFTDKMSEDEIAICNSNSSCLSHTTKWDLSTSLLLPENAHLEQCDNKVCIRPAYSDICSQLTTTVTCARENDSYNLTKFIHADFLSGLSNQNKIPQYVPFKLPGNITADLPPKCTNLTVVYSCLDDEKPTNVSDLKPFTNYTCTGEIREDDAIIANLSTISVKIDCDLKIQNVTAHKTNTSIALVWTTASENCSDVIAHLDLLSYTCICVPQIGKGMQRVGMANKLNEIYACNVNGLASYTNYICEIQPMYNNLSVEQASKHDFTTAIGVPDGITGLQAVVVDSNNIKVTCDHSNRFNGPMKEFNAILLRGSTVVLHRNKECKFLFQDLSYSTTYQVEIFVSNLRFNSTRWKETVTTYYNDKALTGFLIFLIIFTSVALLVVIYRIYLVKCRRFQDTSEDIPLIPNATSVEPIEANIFLEAYKRKLADEGRLFLAEFQSIPKIFTRYTVREAKKTCNLPKNRYADILPYDYSRVHLSTGNGGAGSDYINASFIDGYKESKKYIAAQGPKEETVCDFWRMMWEQRSSIIVMVTRCEEGNKNKCVQYWPSLDRETEIFEEFVVKLNSEDHFPDYSIRHLNLSHRKDNSERDVTHIQFLSWPDHGVPEEPHLLLKLRRRVNAFKNVFSGPIVVHCSAGVGRTGTYICIDAMMECLEAEGKVDIYGFVFSLRKHRCLMVQVEAQYILIHQALLEHNQFGETEISLSELHSALSILKESNCANEPTLLEDEFERLPTYKWKTFNTGITEENKKKNRCSSIIPYDYNRVLLRLDERQSQDSSRDEYHEEESSDSEDDEESTKYINASNIHGYWGPRSFIVAQTPLANTVSDFWLMVYQKKVSTIVMLSGASPDVKESVYWDKENTGDIEVEVTSTDASPNIINRNVLIRHVKRKESHAVRHVEFLKWANSLRPQNPQDLTEMIKDVKRSCDCGKTQRGPPVVVHCSDGSSRCGVFCALWNLLDSAETEKVVDIFHVTRTLRKERQGMIASLDQYQFLYDALDAAYPVQNGEVKAVQASEMDSVQLVNESTTTEKASDEVCTTEVGQQGAAESDDRVAQISPKKMSMHHFKAHLPERLDSSQ